MKAILLAGGKGTRLRPLTLHTPEAHRSDLRSAVSAVPDRPAAAGAGDRRDRPQPELPAAPHRGGLRRRLATSASTSATSSSPTPLGTGGAIKFAAGDDPRRADRRVQRRRVHVGRSAGRARAASRAPGQGDDRADAGGQSRRPTAWSRPTRTATSSASSRSRRPTRSAATRSTPASTCSSRTRSTAFPPTRAYSIERGYFPSLVDERRDVRRATSTAATGSTSARRRSTGRRTATSWTAASSAPPFADGAGHGASSRPTARIDDGAIDRGAVLHRRRRGRQGRRAHRPVHA